MLEREELEALRPTPDRTIHIEAFVPLDQIDPVYFERSYHVVPGWSAEGGAEKAYGLLVSALERSRRVGVARFVMRTREYLAAVRPRDGALGLETLFFADEVQPVTEVLPYGIGADASARELDVAVRLIEIMAKHSGKTPERIKDDMERNYYMSAEQAREYGIIDEVISKRG